MSDNLFSEWELKGKDYSRSNKPLFQTLRKKKKLDDDFHDQHEQIFDEIDCLDCANCCKTTSPIFQQNDIARLAKSLKMKTADFIENYLHLDEDNDYVLNSAPCPFLGHDNKCIVYNNRPTACKEYPHTNRKRMSQILKKTFKNAEICPAVYHILERIKTQTISK